MQGWHNKPVSHRFGSSARTGSGSSLADSCLVLVDAGLCSILWIAPLFLGGRHDVGRLVFVLLCAATASAWFCRQALLKEGKWTRSWAVAVLLATVALVGLTLVPFNSAWLARLVPNTLSLLPLWTSLADESPRLGYWQTISVEPEATRMALAMLVAQGLLFLTALGRLQTLDDIGRLLKAVAFAAMLMAGIGLAQYFTSASQFLWIYELPFGNPSDSVKGCFSNRNHFAQFLAMGIGPLIAWILLRRTRQTENTGRGGMSQEQFSGVPIGTVSLIVALVVVLFAALLSFSRGGAIALAVATVVLLLVYRRSGFVPSRILFGAAALGVVVVGLLSVYGYERLAHRMDGFASGSLEELDFASGRRKIWSANLTAFQQHWQAGTGAGSHRAIYPVYLGESSVKEYTHAESSPLQIASETGLPGVVLLAVGLLLIAGWCFRSIRHATTKQTAVYAGAISAGLAASVVHSAVDFIWYIPACLSVAILLAACALRLSQLVVVADEAKRAYVSLGRWQSLGMATAVSLAGVWSVSIYVGPALAAVHWDRYLQCSIEKKQLNFKQLVAASAAGDQERQLEELLNQTMIEHLQRVVHWRPGFARGHLRLAGKLLRQFEYRQQHSDNAMTSEQIRDAANASGFGTSEQLGQWLRRAFGENTQLLYQAYFHARRAAQLGPLQGEAYLYLANLCFLEGAGQEGINAYIDQALKVRPNDGDVLFEAGKQSVLQGRNLEALEHWKIAFRDAGIHRLHIINMFVQQASAESFLETFRPDRLMLGPLWREYRKAGRAEDMQAIATYAANYALQESSQLNQAQASSLWVLVGSMQSELDDWQSAAISYHKAHQLAPSEFQPHRLLGQALLKTGQYAAAQTHFRWCLSHRPHDAFLQRVLLEAINGQLSLNPSMAQRPAKLPQPQITKPLFQQ